MCKCFEIDELTYDQAVQQLSSRYCIAEAGINDYHTFIFRLLCLGRNDIIMM